MKSGDRVTCHKVKEICNKRVLSESITYRPIRNGLTAATYEVTGRLFGIANMVIDDQHTINNYSRNLLLKVKVIMATDYLIHF